MAKNCSGKGLTSHCSIVKVVFESSAQIAQCSRCMVVLCGLLCQASPKPPKLFPESDAFEVDYFLQCATCEKRKLEALSRPDSSVLVAFHHPPKSTPLAYSSFYYMLWIGR